LSMPKTYADIVEGMKCERGCRAWRDFAVFEDDDVDMTKSAVEVAKQTAARCERKVRALNSCSSGTNSQKSLGSM